MNNKIHNDNKERMPLSMKNYILMLAGAAIIVIGFMLMSGGGDHTETYFDESIYSTRRITIAPIVVILGFAFEIYAIMKRFPEKSDKR
jgi:membrane-bound ClpP family serine protease